MLLCGVFECGERCTPNHTKQLEDVQDFTYKLECQSLMQRTKLVDLTGGIEIHLGLVLNEEPM